MDNFWLQVAQVVELKMKSEEIIAKLKRFPYSGDFWFEMAYGTAFYSAAFGLLLLLALKSFPITESIPSLIPFAAMTPIFVYFYWRQNTLKTFKTPYKKSTNFNNVRTSLRKLGWTYSTHQGIIYLGSKPSILRWVYVRIVPEDNEILYRF